MGAPPILLVCGVMTEFILYPLSAIEWVVLHSKALLAASGGVDEAF